MMLLFWVICIHLHVPLSFIFYFLHKGANTTSRARRLIALIKAVGAKESKTNLVFFHTEAPLWKHSELRWRWLKFKWSLICTTRYSIALMQTFSFKRSWYGSQVKQKQLSQLIFYRIGISCSIHCLSWLHLIPPHIGKKKKWDHDQTNDVIKQCLFTLLWQYHTVVALCLSNQREVVFQDRCVLKSCWYVGHAYLDVITAIMIMMWDRGVYSGSIDMWPYSSSHSYTVGNPGLAHNVLPNVCAVNSSSHVSWGNIELFRLSSVEGAGLSIRSRVYNEGLNDFGDFISHCGKPHASHDCVCFRWKFDLVCQGKNLEANVSWFSVCADISPKRRSEIGRKKKPTLFCTFILNVGLYSTWLYSTCFEVMICRLRNLT